VTASPYDSPLSALREQVEDLAVALAIWEARTEPDAHARRCAGDAVDAIDAALRELHSVRQQLISEIRQADDATAARADALLRDQEGRQQWASTSGRHGDMLNLIRDDYAAHPVSKRIAGADRPETPGCRFLPEG